MCILSFKTDILTFALYIFFCHRKRGYKLPSDESQFSGDTKVICNVEALEAEGLEKCLRKSRVYPLKTWEHNPYGRNWLMPQDTNYCASEPFGNNWRTPRIKGWKQPLCFEYWSDYNEIASLGFVLVWYMLWGAVLHFSWLRSNIKTINSGNKSMKYKKVSTDEMRTPKDRARSSASSASFDLDEIHIETPRSRSNAQVDSIYYRGNTSGTSFTASQSPSHEKRNP